MKRFSKIAFVLLAAALIGGCGGQKAAMTKEELHKRLIDDGNEKLKRMGTKVRVTKIDLVQESESKYIGYIHSTDGAQTKIRVTVDKDGYLSEPIP